MISTLSFSQRRDTFHLKTVEPSHHVTIPGQKQSTCRRLPWPISIAVSCSEPGGATLNVSPRRVCDFTAAKHQKLKSQMCCKHEHEDGNRDLRDIMDYFDYTASQMQGHIDRLSPTYTNTDPVIRQVAFIRYYMQMFPAGRTCVIAAGFNHSWRTTCINRTINKLRHISLIFYHCCRYKKSEQGIWLCRSGSWRRTLPSPTNICQRLD